MKTSRFSNWKLAVLALGATCVLLAQSPAAGRGGGLGFRFTGGGLGLANLMGKAVTGAPFSAKLTTALSRTLGNGNQIQRQEQADVYRDSQGRVRIDATFTEPTSAGSQTRTEITIYDPVAGYVYRLNPQNMTAVQSPIHQRTAPANGSAPPANGQVQTQTQNLGTQTINGLSATGTQLTRTIAAEAVGNTQPIQIVRVTWVATALQIPVQVTLTDPRSGNSMMNLTNIVQSEPSASLFVVPAGYTVTSAPGRGFGGARR